MATLAIIGMVVFCILFSVMSYTCGIQTSISSLAYRWRWLLLVALLSQVLLLPQMLTITPNALQWLAFIGVSGIVVCGSANVLDKADETVHVIAAIVAFTALTIWVLFMNWVLALPIVLCAISGFDKIKWMCEVGLIISVYLVILMSII